jgi:hypothetical protein
MQRMSNETIVSSLEVFDPPANGVADGAGTPSQNGVIGSLWKIWQKRHWLAKIGAWALIVSTVVAFLIPVKF